MTKKEIAKHLKRMMTAYGPCAMAQSPEGCEICSARHAPYNAIKDLHGRLTKKRRAASTRNKE